MRYTLLLAATLAGTLPAQTPTDSVDVPQVMVARLELEKYKATIKGLTAFGDRRQGTDRNRAALDWIEAQLKSYGCTNTERIHYTYEPPAGRGGRGGAAGAGPGRGGAGAQGQTLGPGGARRRGVRQPDAVNNDPLKQPDLKLRELNTPPSVPG